MWLNKYLIKSHQQSYLPWKLFTQNKFGMSFNKLVVATYWISSGLEIPTRPIARDK